MNKAIWKSKTVLAAVFTVLALSFPGVWMNLGLGEDYAGIAEKASVVIGQILVIYGRFAAGGVSLTGK